MTKLIQEALANLNIDALTEMQVTTVNAAKQKNDIVLLSPTGTGKTLAFLLSMLEAMDASIRKPQVLIVAPARELALQIEEVFTKMKTPWKACCCYGGHATGEERKRILNIQPTVIVGTPGRLLDHMGQGNIDTSAISILIIDEFDKSLELGFQEEMQEIIGSLPALKKRMLLSATDAEEIPQFVQMQQAAKLNFLANQSDEEKLKLMVVKSEQKDKVETLFKLLCSLKDSSSIVFCNHRESVDRVQKLLKEMKMECAAFHGGMEQKDREKALYKFKNGSSNILIATDLAARGLDIPEVEHIIHYHIPINEEAFTHRNGRTARWMATGNSYIILGPTETLPAYYEGKNTEEYVLNTTNYKPYQSKWVTLYIGKGKKDKLSRADVAGFFYKKGNLNRDEMGQISVNEHSTFVAVKRTKVKQLLTLVKGEKIKGIKTIIEIAN